MRSSPECFDLVIKLKCYVNAVVKCKCFQVISAVTQAHQQLSLLVLLNDHKQHVCFGSQQRCESRRSTICTNISMKKACISQYGQAAHEA